MKTLFVCAGALALVLTLALLLRREGRSAGPDDAREPLAPPFDAAASGEVERLRAEVAVLRRRLEVYESQGESERVSVALAPTTAQAIAVPPRDPLWYLEQYVLSFEDADGGAPYLRAVVDAHAVELAAPILTIAVDTSRLEALRLALVAMLGKRKLSSRLDVQDALVTLAVGPDALAIAAFRALAAIGNDRVLPAIETLVARARDRRVADAGLDAAWTLAGARWNATLLSILGRAVDVDLRASLPARLDAVDVEGALAFEERASTDELPVRRNAALALSEFPFDEFRALARRWLAVETERAVIVILERYLAQEGSFPSWHAMNATGAPDADARNDDPKAWASASPDMGAQWLELDYASPTHASGVRIFETCSAGALAAVEVRDADGRWTSVWKGETSSRLEGPLVLEWRSTAAPVKSIRLVLETDRTPGWNEIDAVELLGSAGPQWATRARASSTFGSSVEAPRMGSQFAREPGSATAPR